MRSLIANKIETKVQFVVDDFIRFRSRGISTFPEIAPTRLRDVNEMPGPLALPILGSALQYRPIGEVDPQTRLTNSIAGYYKYGRIWKETMPLTGKPMVHLYEPRHFETVARMDGRLPVRPIFETLRKYREEKGYGPGFANLQGEAWYQYRQPVNKLLLDRRAAWPYLEAQSRISADWIMELANQSDPDGQVKDLEDLIALWNLVELCQISFGDSAGSMPAALAPQSWHRRFLHHSRIAMDLVAELLFSSNQLWRIYRTDGWRKFEHSMDVIHEMTMQFVDEEVARRRTSSGVKRNGAPTLCDHLLDSVGLSETQVMLYVLDVLAAGIETTSAGMLFILFNLAKNPRAQDELFREIRDRVGTKGEIQDCKVKFFDDFPYLRAAIKESHRISPVSGLLFRQLSEDVALDGYRIPAKTALLLQTGATGKIEDYYERPGEFLPERWIRMEGQEEKFKGAEHLFVILPFGVGARSCLGKRLAEQILQLGTLHVARNFRLDLEDPDEEMIFLSKTFNKPMKTPGIRFHRREESL